MRGETAGDDAARTLRWRQRNPGLGHQERSACSQTTVLMSG